MAAKKSGAFVGAQVGAVLAGKKDDTRDHANRRQVILPQTGLQAGKSRLLSALCAQCVRAPLIGGHIPQLRRQLIGIQVEVVVCACLRVFVRWRGAIRQ